MIEISEDSILKLIEIAKTKTNGEVNNFFGLYHEDFLEGYSMGLEDGRIYTARSVLNMIGVFYE